MGKRAVMLFVVWVLVWDLCACTASRPETPDEAAFQLPTWQEQYDLGIRYLSEGNYEEAILVFTAAIEIDPKQAPAYVGRGDAYVLSGETEDNLLAAKADYERAIELDETSVEAYLGLADVYIRQGDYEKALEILQVGYDKTENTSIKELFEELNSSAAPPLNSLGGTEFFSRTSYIEFATLPEDAQNAVIAIISAVISDDENALISMSDVSDEAFRSFVYQYTFWNGYKIKSNELPSNGESYGLEFRSQTGMGYYCYVYRTANTNSVDIIKCMCTDWNYNGVIEEKEVRHSQYASELNTEYGTMVNGLREGTFTSTHKYGNDSPWYASKEYKNGILVSSTIDNYDTQYYQDDYVHGIDGSGYSMSQDAMDKLFW